MKPRNIFNNKTLIIIISVVLGGAGSLLFGVSPFIGGGLIILSVLYNIFLTIQSEARSREADYYLETQAKLFAELGKGNLYMEEMKLELKKTGKITFLKQKLYKALNIEPKNFEALATLSMINALDLAFSQWLSISERNSKSYKCSIITKQLVDRGLSLYPKEHIFHDAKGIIYDVEGEHKKARKEFVISSKLRTDPFWHFLMATSWHMSGNHENALKEMEQAQSEGASGRIFQHYYGRALESVGDYENAQVHLVEAVKQKKPEVRLLYRLSYVYHMLGDFAKSSKYFLFASFSIITINPKLSLVYFFRACFGLFIASTCSISKFLWKFTKRIPFLRKIHLNIAPPQEPEFTIGISLAERNHFRAAEKLFKKAILTNPEDAKAYANLALCQALQNNIPEAIKNIDQAIKYDPNNEKFKLDKKQFETEKNFRA